MVRIWFFALDSPLGLASKSLWVVAAATLYSCSADALPTRHGIALGNVPDVVGRR